MSLILYPRAVTHQHPGASSSDRLRFWVGAFDQTRAPALRWKLNGAEVVPDALRPVQSVRPDSLLPGGAASSASVARAFAGVYEFTRLASGEALAPDTEYAVSVEADGLKTAAARARTLPARVTSDLNKTFNVLLVSCFHQAEDRGGLAGSIVEQLRSDAVHRPHLTLLLGDQVYLDLPPIKNFPDDPAWLARKFEDDYRRNWLGPEGYAKIHAAAPSVATPDDHEYWNNFPHAATIIQNTWTPAGRDAWRRGAVAMYEGFQMPVPARLGEAGSVEVAPLSFFVADTRSAQSPNLTGALSLEAFAQLRRWVAHVKEKRLFGVFVCGQSVFREKPGKYLGKVMDYELPNYEDFPALLRQLQELADAGRPLLCVTGDVHWGRVLSARDLRHGGREMIHEIISSPASLVSGAVPSGVSNLVGGLTGNPWPRHSEAGEPYFSHETLGGRFRLDRFSVKHRQKGNHVALLSFRDTGGGLSLRIKYLPVHPDARHRARVEVDELYLPQAV